MESSNSSFTIFCFQVITNEMHLRLILLTNSILAYFCQLKEACGLLEIQNEELAFNFINFGLRQPDFVQITQQKRQDYYLLSCYQITLQSFYGLCPVFSSLEFPRLRYYLSKLVLDPRIYCLLHSSQESLVFKLTEISHNHCYARNFPSTFRL